jgi:Tfp pilus assembly protein PilN
MSSIQFNLLPEVKLNFIKARRTQKVVTGIALLVAGVALVFFILLLFTVDVVQKKQLRDASGQIKEANQKLNNIDGLGQIVTVQNQLQTLASLHHNKHAVSRFSTYLPHITPTNVSIGSMAIDFTQNSMIISGTADSQKTVNTFIDTLKFTTFKTSESAQSSPAFPSVVETSFSIATGSASYSLTVQFDPKLFDNNLAATPVLNVPQLTSTRSVLDDPNNSLFNGRSGQGR